MLVIAALLGTSEPASAQTPLPLVIPSTTRLDVAGPTSLGFGQSLTIGGFNAANHSVTIGGELNIASALTVNGGFLRNNGIVSGAGTLNITNGGVVKGGGDYDLAAGPNLSNGGKFLLGNSPGMARLTNGSISNGGITGGDFSNANGTPG
ncbi:MAG: hypothetical protein ACRCZF_06125, partial [Gemmataceae bacterium]